MQFFQQRRSGAEQNGVARQHRCVADVLGNHRFAQTVATDQDQVAGFGEEVQGESAFDNVALDLGGPGPIEVGHGLKLLDLGDAEPPLQAAVRAFGRTRSAPGVPESGAETSVVWWPAPESRPGRRERRASPICSSCAGQVMLGIVVTRVGEFIVGLQIVRTNVERLSFRMAAEIDRRQRRGARAPAQQEGDR